MLDAKSTDQVSRSHPPIAFLALWTATSCLLLSPVAQADPSENKISLSELRRVDEISRVRALLEVKGHLTIDADSDEPLKHPLEVTGKFAYDERILKAGGQSPADAGRCSVRHYERAEASFTVGEGHGKRGLSEDRRLIVMHRANAATTVFSPHGSLTREQRDLLDIPGNSLLLAELLPVDALSEGETWDVTEEGLLGLFGWDTVVESAVQGTLAAVEDGSATIEFAGIASGTVAGTASDVELRAKCLFDVQRRRVRWFGMAVRENRKMGPAEPGFQVTAKLQVVISPCDDSEPLGDDNLARLSLTPDAGSDLLRVESADSGCRLLADRRWFVIRDLHDVTILRFVDDGEPIGQCNITSMPDVAAGKHVSLEQFQQDIRKSLGDNFGQFIEASQSRTDEGLRVLRVSATGVVSDVNVQWAYYLISNEKGRRTALVFTCGQKVSERFGAADRALASGFQFIDRVDDEPAKLTELPTDAGTRQ
jgi:hypothetical protein